MRWGTPPEATKGPRHGLQHAGAGSLGGLWASAFGTLQGESVLAVTLAWP